MSQAPAQIAAPLDFLPAGYAGFWLRFAAYLIDGVLLWVVEMVLILGVYAMAPGGLLLTVIRVSPVAAAIAWAYYALMESSPIRGTVGKHALGLYVSDLNGDPITFRRASWRYILKILSTLTLLMGWLMAAFTPQKQALHDVLAGTLVLRNAEVVRVQHPAEALEDYWDGMRWVSRPKK